MQAKPGLRNVQPDILLAVIGLCAGGRKSGRMDSCFRRNDDGCGNDDECMPTPAYETINVTSCWP